ncbi:hypothetical protein IFM89_034692, partial [Coptis chinensis]
GASGIGWSFPTHVESFDAMWSVAWTTSIHKELMTKVHKWDIKKEEESGEADEEEEKGEIGEVDEKGEADEEVESESNEVDEEGEADEEEESKSDREEEEKKESDGEEDEKKESDGDKEEKKESDGEEVEKKESDGEEAQGKTNEDEEKGEEETKLDGEEESGDTKSDGEEEKGEGEPNSMFKKVKERERIKKTSTIYEFEDIKKRKRKTKITEPVIDVDDFETPPLRRGRPMSKPHSNKLWRLLDKEKMSLVESFFKKANQNTIAWMDIQTHLKIQGEQLNHMMLNFFIIDKIIDWYVFFHLPKEVVKLIGYSPPKCL